MILCLSSLINYYIMNTNFNIILPIVYMSECTICFERMNLKKDRLTQCYLCGNTVHTKCYEQWKKKAGPFVPEKCLYCQCDNHLYKINRSWWEKIMSFCC